MNNSEEDLLGDIKATDVVELQQTRSRKGGVKKGLA